LACGWSLSRLSSLKPEFGGGQATALPNPSARNFGSIRLQMDCAVGRRVTKRQPLSEWSGFGVSPFSANLTGLNADSKAGLSNGHPYATIRYMLPQEGGILAPVAP
jgi:hypothetical protein